MVMKTKRLLVVVIRGVAKYKEQNYSRSRQIDWYCHRWEYIKFDVRGVDLDGL